MKKLFLVSLIFILPLVSSWTCDSFYSGGSQVYTQSTNGSAGGGSSSLVLWFVISNLVDTYQNAYFNFTNTSSEVFNITFTISGDELLNNKSVYNMTTPDFSSYFNLAKTNCLSVSCARINDSYCEVPMKIEGQGAFSYYSSYDFYRTLSSGGISYSSDFVYPQRTVKQFFNYLAEGASFKELLIEWNPSAYYSLLEGWAILWDVKNIDNFPSNLLNYMVLMVKYIFREPASLGGDFYAE